MENTTEQKIDKSKLYEEAEKKTPKFASNEEALIFYVKELETLSNKYKCSISDLIKKAEEEPMNDDFSLALSLSRKVQFLKQASA